MFSLISMLKGLTMSDQMPGLLTRASFFSRGWKMKGCLLLFTMLLFVSGSTLAAFAGQPQSQSTSNAATAPSTQTGASVVTQAPNAAPADAVPQTSQPVSAPRIVAPGTTIVAELAGSLKANKLKAGDKVKAVLAQDFVAGGRLVAKYGSKVIGHVTEVKKRTQADPESRLGIVFDKILLKKHQELDFQAIVQALAPPVLRRSRVDEPDQMMPPGVRRVGGDSIATGGRGSGPRSTVPVATMSSATVLGPVATVQSNPGSNPGDSVSRIRTGGDKNSAISGGVGMHGVYGLKNLELRAPAPGVNSGPAIVSTKSDVKLQSGTQVLILVVN
jgi:hypothetical protein